MRGTAALILFAGCRAAAAPSDGLAWQAPVDIATGGGTKGPWQQNDSTYDFVDDASVALGPDGTPYVVWVDHRDKDVHFRDVNVSRSPSTFSWLPRIAVDGKDVYVSWQEIIFSPGGSHGGEILFARSTDGGATFEAPVNLSNSVEGDGKGRITAEIWHNGSLDLAVGRGAIHAAWTSYDGGLYAASSRDGLTWTAPKQVAGTREKPARAPSLAIGDAVYLAWTYGEDMRADIHVARDFGAPVVVAKTATYSDAPKLAVDDRGTLHVAYAETSGDAFATSRVMYARSTDGTTFTKPRAIGDEGSFPSLAVDERRVVIAYELGSAASARTARGLGIAMSPDFRARVIPGSADEAPNGSQQGRLQQKLAVRGGAIAIVNSALRAGTSSRVWMVRGHLRTSR